MTGIQYVGDIICTGGNFLGITYCLVGILRIIILRIIILWIIILRIIILGINAVFTAGVKSVVGHR